jgi:hypothetical protein
MKKTGLSVKNNNDGDYMGTNFGTMGQSGKEFGVNSSNSASLKGKLQTLEVNFKNFKKLLFIGSHSASSRGNEQA